MARKPETTFLDSIRAKFPRELHHEKMNNPYRGGTADLWVSGKKADVWIEAKWFPKTPKVFNLTEGKKPMLSPLQQRWLRGRHGEGRNVAVLVGSPDGCLLLKGIEWELTHTFDAILTRQEAADWIVRTTM